MDAHVYRPAIAYEQPVIVPTPLNVETTSLARLMADPAAKTIVVKEAPMVTFLANIEQMKPHWDNVSLRSLVPVGVVTQTALDRIERQLRALPRGGAR